MFTAFLEINNKNNNFIPLAVKSTGWGRVTCECNLTGFSVGGGGTNPLLQQRSVRAGINPRQSANYRNSFDVLNMKSDHRTKQLSANGTCQQRSTPAISTFLSAEVCYSLPALTKISDQSTKINIAGFHRSSQEHRRRHTSFHFVFWYRKRWNGGIIRLTSAAVWPTEYDFNFVKRFQRVKQQHNRRIANHTL